AEGSEDKGCGGTLRGSPESGEDERRGGTLCGSHESSSDQGASPPLILPSSARTLLTSDLAPAVAGTSGARMAHCCGQACLILRREAIDDPAASWGSDDANSRLTNAIRASLTRHLRSQAAPAVRALTSTRSCIDISVVSVTC